MTAASKAKWDRARAGLPEGLRPALDQMYDDYMKAQRTHVPNYTGGPNAEILAELLRAGWRKPDSN